MNQSVVTHFHFLWIMWIVWPHGTLCPTAHSATTAHLATAAVGAAIVGARVGALPRAAMVVPAFAVAVGHAEAAIQVAIAAHEGTLHWSVEFIAE